MAIVDGIVYDARDPANPRALCKTEGTAFVSKERADGSFDSAWSRAGDRAVLEDCYFQGGKNYPSQLSLTLRDGTAYDLGRDASCANRGWTVSDHLRVAFSPSGTLLLVVHTRVDHAQVRLFGVQGGRLVWSSEPREAARPGKRFAEWFPKDDRLLLVEATGVSVRDPSGDIRELATMRLEDVSISPSGDLFAGTNRGGPARATSITRVEVRRVADGSLVTSRLPESETTGPPGMRPIGRSRPHFLGDSWLWYMRDLCPCPDQGVGYGGGEYHDGAVLALDLRTNTERRLPMSNDGCNGSPTHSCPRPPTITDIWHD
jgi:hypothetical protein